jgi:hypothetical protein
VDPSTLKDLILPSFQPEIITSSVKVEQFGNIPAAVTTEHLAITV